MATSLYIGLMSGTSLDGIDAVLVDLAQSHPKVLGHSFKPYNHRLRAALLALQHDAPNELETAALLNQDLTILYAEAIHALMIDTNVSAAEVHAIGCHGQTVRHRPELGFTLQLGNAALLAELTKMTVVADFRSRDIAAGGQGAPLVPAFHHAVFAHSEHNRVVLNIGGIANITYLPTQGDVVGFDTGPGNMLMNAWTEQHLNVPYDKNGDWAATGVCIPALLEKLLSHAYLVEAPPKSTGRDVFNIGWLQGYLKQDYLPQDVERTLLEFTAVSISDAIWRDCKGCDEVYVCGGGAFNHLLMQRIKDLIAPVIVQPTDTLGLGVSLVESVAFAWLAKQCINKKTGNLPQVTGAKGTRILGAIYYN